MVWSKDEFDKYQKVNRGNVRKKTPKKTGLIIVCLILLFIFGMILTNNADVAVQTVSQNDEISNGIKVVGKLTSNDVAYNAGVVEWTIKNETDRSFTGDINLHGDFGSGFDIYTYKVEDLRPGVVQTQVMKTKYIPNDKIEYQVHAAGKLVEFEIEKSEFAYDEIFFLEGPNMVFLQVDKISMEAITAIVKELRSKYGEKMGAVHIFDKSQPVAKGTKPNLAEIDPKAGYLPGDKTIHIYETNETVVLD